MSRLRTTRQPVTLRPCLVALAFATLVGLTAAGAWAQGTSTAPPAATADTAAADRLDRHSFANPTEARVTHVSLDLRADFAARVLEGTATLSIARTSGRSIVLDTNGLTVVSVTSAAGDPLEFRSGVVRCLDFCNRSIHSLSIVNLNPTTLPENLFNIMLSGKFSMIING